MKLYNLLTRNKDELVVKNNKIKMYVCGPTVYNYFHIGNARCFVMFDALRRYLEFKGYEVEYILNFTDVDDKLIQKAEEEQTTVPKLAEKYINAFYKDARGLGIKDATHHPRATENIDNIIKIIKILIEKNHAYQINGNVYFSTASDPNYGRLLNVKTDDLEAGARIDINSEKRDPFDFALWKSQKETSEIAWDSPWGKGRPGWHIECSAMIDKYFGGEIDIHCGGEDLVFPHHENEIAQSSCAFGHGLARFWLHNAFITVENKKMSKSKGDCFWIYELAEIYGYRVIRFFLISAHYNVPLNHSADIILQAKAGLERLDNCADNIDFIKDKLADCGISGEEAASIEYIEQKRAGFFNSLDDDFNTAEGISFLFEITREINTRLAKEKVSKEFYDKAVKIFNELTELLGLSKEIKLDNEAEIESLVKQRNEAKAAKNYSEADRIRNLLKEMNIIIEDTPKGTRWKKI